MRRSTIHRVRPLAVATLALGLLACGPGASPSAPVDDTGTTVGSSDPSATSSPTVATDSEGDSTSSQTTAPSTESSTGPLDDTSSTGGECDPQGMIECGGILWGCGNGLDDDGDGLVDLDDPECITLCDDSEDVFPQSIPGDSTPCRSDCGFDGNRGAGDDGCQWNPICDPMTPVGKYCGYDPESPACTDLPIVPPECVGFCEPLVPNGCDCFGCCTFLTDAGPVDRLISGDGIFSQPPYHECSLDQLDACPPCTQQLELCGNPCEVDQCEVCFGQTEPAGPCESVSCVGGTACLDRCDCAPGEFCQTGCCSPIPW